MITFYDLASIEGVGTASPNSWKTRYVLNYKKLPYKTVSLEFPDIEPELRTLGIPPSSVKSDGTPSYTIPSIIDHETNTLVSDSYKITEYLDKAYPNTPQVIPKGTEALQAVFYDQLHQMIGPLIPFIIPAVPSILNPVSAEYFARTRREIFGKPIEELEPVGEARVEAWKKVEGFFNTLDGWLNKSNGPFFFGETITFADFVVTSVLLGLKLTLKEESKEWRDIMEWNNGRWKALLESLKGYARANDEE